MNRDLLKEGFPFKLPLHTYRLQRSNHSGRVRMRKVMCVEARMMTMEGHFTETLFNLTSATLMDSNLKWSGVSVLFSTMYIIYWKISLLYNYNAGEK